MDQSNRIFKAKPASPGWYWRKVFWDDYRLIGPAGETRKHLLPTYVESLDGKPLFSFRSYAALCWWCRTRGINPILNPEL